MYVGYVGRVWVHWTVWLRVCVRMRVYVCILCVVCCVVCVCVCVCVCSSDLCYCSFSFRISTIYRKQYKLLYYLCFYNRDFSFFFFNLWLGFVFSKKQKTEILRTNYTFRWIVFGFRLVSYILEFYNLISYKFPPLPCAFSSVINKVLLSLKQIPSF